MGLSRKVLIYFYLLTSLLQGYNENIKKSMELRYTMIGNPV